MSKYIFISGGVISGIGKGISASSIAVLLKSYGYKITMIKADPYLNIDAGTMNPLEHGETFVLENGFETDMDIGSYERYTGEIFSRDNSMTLGAVIDEVLRFERKLAYDGKWVSMDYHVPQAIIKWLKRVEDNSKADIVIVEIGGTVGEVANQIFLEANRVLKTLNPQDVVHIHVSYLPVPGKLGEMKSKPVQVSVKLLNMAGISPEFIIARSEGLIDDIRREKLSLYCTVKKENVIAASDVDNIYDVPVNYSKQEFGEKIMKSLSLTPKVAIKNKTGGELIESWKKKINTIKNIKKTVKIAMIGKYIVSGNYSLKDSYVSVIEAINHASWELGYKTEILWLQSESIEKNNNLLKKIKEVDGVIVPQGWGSRGVEGKISAIEYVRENKIPYLGLCFGMQMAVIEYARNVLGIKDANSEEVKAKGKNNVIHMMEYQRKLVESREFGGTIRLGAYPCEVLKGSLLHSLYSKYKNEIFPSLPIVQERHRHRYEFNNAYREKFINSGMVLSGLSPDKELVEAIELPVNKHPFFLGTQYHPELKTHFTSPHPIFMGFIKASTRNK